MSKSTQSQPLFLSVALKNMANSKSVAELPRFLLPRLTWTGKSSRLSTSPLKAAACPAKTLVVSQIQQPRRRRSFTTATHPTPRSSSILSGYRRLPKVPSRSLDVDSPPIRYDGVYVASFKPARRAFHATTIMAKDHHFDTLKFVQKLKDEGFSEEQAAAMMRVLNDVIEESIQNLTRTMVLREDAERSTYTQKVDFAKLRSELMNSDSTESQLTRTSHERITSDLSKLSNRLRDEISRTQASVRLDLNLEKGRIKEEANTQEMRIKETEARIEQEVASLRERVEAVKFSTLQWLMGVCTGTAALILGAWRLLM